jgi:rod shape determining protein RodA
MLERRLYYHVDWAMLAGIFALCAIGLAQIYSATGGFTRIYYTQIYGILFGIFAMAICLSVDYRSLADKSHWIYLGILLLLMYVLFFGAVRGGSRRWIDLGVVNLQPSEFAKAALALVLAKFFGESRRGAITREDLAIAAAIAAVPLILIARSRTSERRSRSFRSSLPLPTWRACRCASSASSRSLACWSHRSPGNSR